MVGLAYEAHEHHASAIRWIEGLADGSLNFCRFTQMGLLRLLTHPSVMREDVKSQQEAWEAYDSIFQDDRVRFLQEPDAEHLDSVFRQLTSVDRASSKQWPDAYLVAFAQAADLTVVTFDRGLRQMDPHRAKFLR